LHIALLLSTSVYDEDHQIDVSVKRLLILFSVIPAKAGIKLLQTVVNSLDSGLRRSDGLFAKPSKLLFH